MRKNRRTLSILLTFAMLAALLLPMATPAFAASDNYAVSVTKVEANKDGQVLGSVVVKEDPDTDGEFVVGDVITVSLPSGVEYDDFDSVYDAAYEADFVESSTLGFSIAAAGENFLSVEITSLGAGTDEKLTFHFGAGNRVSTVDIDSGVTGDIKVEIEADGTSMSSDFITVARVFDGGTITTISDVKTLGLDTTGLIGTIRISETSVGKLDPSGKFIEMVLPNDFEWNVPTAWTTNAAGAADIIGTNGLTAAYESGDADKTLKLKVLTKSSGTQPGFLALSGLSIFVPDDADEGEVEMKIKGNETTSEDVVIAKVGDFGFKITLEDEVEEFVAGTTENELPEIEINDVVKGTWVKDRTVYMELPSWASFTVGKGQNISISGNVLNTGKVDSKDDNIVKFTATGSDGDANLKDVEIDIDADAPEGDLVVKFYGSAGVEGELVVAKVLAPFKVTADKPEVGIGVLKQQLGDITITESTEGAVEDDKWIIVEAPAGLTFSDTPSVEVTEGDMDIDNDDSDGRYFAFQVTGESGKTASTIEITDVYMDFDRTIPVGDIVFKIYLSSTDFEDDVASNTAKDRFDDVIDDRDYRDEVTSVVVGTVKTPAPDQTGTSAMLWIGSSIYNVNGTMKAMDVAPYVKDGRSYAPVRYIAEICGVASDDIGYDEATKTVTLKKGDTVVTLVIGSKTITVNGVATEMDVAPEVVNGRTMLPARFVAEAFGYIVAYDSAAKTIVISN